MRENKITRTIEEVNGYIADDGTWFRTKEECQKYEESAKMVLFNMVKDKLVGKTNIYHLLEEGCEDCDAEIYSVDSMKTLELLNRYFSLSTFHSQKNVVSTDMIGKNIIIFWDYDRDVCWSRGTIDDLLNEIRNRYEKVINKETDKDK